MPHLASSALAGCLSASGSFSFLAAFSFFSNLSLSPSLSLFLPLLSSLQFPTTVVPKTTCRSRQRKRKRKREEVKAEIQFQTHANTIDCRWAVSILTIFLLTFSFRKKALHWPAMAQGTSFNSSPICESTTTPASSCLRPPLSLTFSCCYMSNRCASSIVCCKEIYRRCR